jgi:hypothetical protein
MGRRAILDSLPRVARNQESLRTPEASESRRTAIRSPGGLVEVAHRASEVPGGSAEINKFACGIGHVFMI